MWCRRIVFLLKLMFYLIIPTTARTGKIYFYSLWIVPHFAFKYLCTSMVRVGGVHVLYCDSITCKLNFIVTSWLPTPLLLTSQSSRSETEETWSVHFWNLILEVIELLKSFVQGHFKPWTTVLTCDNRLPAIGTGEVFTNEGRIT